VLFLARRSGHPGGPSAHGWASTAKLLKNIGLRGSRHNGGHTSHLPLILLTILPKKSEQIVPTVTGKVYNHSKRMKEKRAVLDGVAAELRRIIGQPAVMAVGHDRLAA
jgi:hypothetical protein